jgi:fructose-bisphosphate aldolase class II
MKVSPKVLFDQCYQSYGIAAVNVFTMEQVIGLFEAASIAKAPFIVQLTPAARNYADSRMLLAMISAAAARFPQAVYSIHLDHGTEAHILDALSASGYDSVMIDASHDPFEENVRRTKSIVEKAHSSRRLNHLHSGQLYRWFQNAPVEKEHYSREQLQLSLI